MENGTTAKRPMMIILFCVITWTSRSRRCNGCSATELLASDWKRGSRDAYLGCRKKAASTPAFRRIESRPKHTICTYCTHRDVPGGREWVPNFWANASWEWWTKRKRKWQGTCGRGVGVSPKMPRTEAGEIAGRAGSLRDPVRRLATAHRMMPIRPMTSWE
jgi:hypothetical protein